MEDLQDYGELQMFKKKNKIRGKSAHSFNHVNKYITK